MNKLKAQRRMLGLTQYDLAKASGIAPGRITFFETGRAKLTPDEIQRVKDALARRAKEVTDALAVA